MKDWLKTKPYTHFSKKFKFTDKGFIRSYVEMPTNIETHRFFPFLHYTIVDKKYKRTRNKNTGKRDKDRSFSTKSRQIYFANHLDAQVFAYYASLLNKELKDIYDDNADLNDSVTAYRPIENGDGRNKCNIDFANEVFSHIRDHDSTDLVALCFDVTSFFDTLDHKILKQKWIELMGDGKKNLPKHHYKVFKAITRFSHVEIRDAIDAHPKLQDVKFKHLKSKSIESFFDTPEDFRANIVDKGLLHSNKFLKDKDGRPMLDATGNKIFRKIGIVQGSPISATLSNVYMLDFDKWMVRLARYFKGMYRRYSDDIIFICPAGLADTASFILKKWISEDLKLEIKDKKTQKVFFHRKSNTEKWSYQTEENGVTYYDKPLSYLGFEFDGETIRLRQRGISSYYRKTKRFIRRRAFYALKSAQKAQNPWITYPTKPWIFRAGIYRHKSHLGAKKKKIDGKVFWGNYYSYILNADKIMNRDGNHAIKRQLRNHWRIIEREIQRFEQEYDLQKTPSKRRQSMMRKKKRSSKP